MSFCGERLRDTLSAETVFFKIHYLKISQYPQYRNISNIPQYLNISDVAKTNYIFLTNTFLTNVYIKTNPLGYPFG